MLSSLNALSATSTIYNIIQRYGLFYRTTSTLSDALITECRKGFKLEDVWGWWTGTSDEEKEIKKKKKKEIGGRYAPRRRVVVEEVERKR